MNDDFTVSPTSVEPTSVAGPAASTPAATLPDRRAATLARIGLLGIGAAALIAVAALAIGSTFAPARTLAGSDSTNGTSGTIEAFGFGGPGFGPGFGGRGGHGFMFGGISITAISGNDISLETEDGWTRTITVDDETEYSKSGDEIALTDLAVGDRIAFGQTLEDDGTFTIDQIAVILPHVGGEVTAVDGSTITVERRDGETATITVNGDTTYEVDGDDATLADVEVGMVLVAEGTENADGSLTATEVKAFDADALDGRPFGGPGRHFGFGFGPFDLDGDSPGATASPEDDASAS